MREDQTQLFKTEYGTRCDTFGCDGDAQYFIGRPDGPLNTNHILCEVCTNDVVESVKQLFKLHEKSVHAPAGSDSVKERLIDVKTHAELDDIVAGFGLKDIPTRENAKLQERKELIAAAVK